MRSFSLLSVIALCLAFSSASWAEVITFDDIDTGGDLVAISNGYAGLDWTNFGAHSPTYVPHSGYASGIVSGSNDAFNMFGAQANFSSTTSFTFVSAYFTGAWNDGLNITIQGLNGSTVLDTATIIVNASAPTLATFNWAGLTEVTFKSFGGTANPADQTSGAGTNFVMDNLTLTSAVPEPATGVWVIAPLLGIVTLRRRPRRI